MIRCVIVEDEEIARNVLKSLLAQYCPDVMVCAEADDVESGKTMINAFRPDLVFLDIEMPGGGGFKLLSGIENADFEVIISGNPIAWTTKAKLILSIPSSVVF